MPCSLKALKSNFRCTQNTNILIMKFGVLCLIVAMTLVHQNKGCSGMKTAVNVCPRNLVDVSSNKSGSAIETNWLYESILRDSHIYTRVAIISLTVVLIFSYKQNRRRMKSKVLKNNTKSGGELLHRLEHLRAVFDATAVGVVAIDQDRLVSYMNATAGQMCGIQPELAVGRPVATVVRLALGLRRSDTISRLHDFSANCLTSDYSTYILRRHDKRSIRVQRIVSPLTVRGKATGTVILLKDVSASMKLMKKLAYSASYDRLTGLPNRSSFESCLAKAVNSLVGRASKHALVFLDLDGFKAVNDTAGHSAGDALLKEIARLLQMQLRHSDFLARLAGDEFGLILFDCELPHATSLMNVVVDNIGQYTFYWAEKRLRVGASAGIVTVDCTSVSTRISELLARADAACYDAKHRGRGQVRVFEERTAEIN